MGVIWTVEESLVGKGSTTTYDVTGATGGAAAVIVIVVGWPDIDSTVVVMVCVIGDAVTVSVSSKVTKAVACETCSDEAAAPEPPSTGTTEYDFRFSKCRSWF